MFNFKDLFFKLCLILLLLFIFSFIEAYSYSKTMFNNISDSFVRFHIIANSDSTSDQIIKYKIRDEIINTMQPYLLSATNKEEALFIISQHLKELQDISNNILQSNQLPYTASVSISSSHFPQKNYSNIFLPEGTYDCLQIKLGNSDGQNWWCIMYPSLCLNTFSISNNFNTNDTSLCLEKEKSKLISSTIDNTTIHFKLKILELFENL